MTGTISIHALREEGDEEGRKPFFSESGISIHALREEGDKSLLTSDIIESKFLSTPSARRATERKSRQIL